MYFRIGNILCFFKEYKNILDYFFESVRKTKIKRRIRTLGPGPHLHCSLLYSDKF